MRFEMKSRGSVLAPHWSSTRMPIAADSCHRWLLDSADQSGVRAVIVVPVDAPLVSSTTVANLIAIFSATGASIVRARYRGRNGHPVIFSRAMFDELRAADPQMGAKAVLRAHATAIVNVDLDDPGVVADVDTPEDYRRLLGA